MKRFQIEPKRLPTTREAEVEYLIDMIAELAKLARRTDEPAVAIHLEAILAARRATEPRDSV